MEKPTKEQEKIMKEFYDSLPEEKKKLYAGVHLVQLGPGSKEYISNLFGCSVETIIQGKKELEEMDDNNL